MSNNKMYILYLVAIFMLSSCSNGSELKQTVLTKDNLVTVQKQVNSGKGLSKEEQEWYMLGQIKISSTGGQVVGKTVGEVIAAGKAGAPKK